MNIIEHVRDSIIGRTAAVPTPFGRMPLVYADYTASGRSLEFIETLIQTQVLPYYSNTHSDSSHTGAQTNHYREQARQIIRECVGGSEQDKVIFCGSGATSAINKLIGLLALERFEAVDDEDRPVVFIGPYEHHSNDLPWRESPAEVVVIPTTPDGQIDQQQLRDKLANYAARPLKIGSFSAASNVTGILSDVQGITRILKSAGALACWDYAAAAPYVQIDMQNLDAAFISPHKFPGGPGTPGLLIAKQHLFGNSVPVTVGGGTVRYVSPSNHLYVEDPEAREEGGTPAIVEAIRAGLVFKLQRDVGTARINQIEAAHAEAMVRRMRELPNVEILGDTDAPRLPIMSFRIKCDQRYLHYSFVTALLNDLFGIQARGGCSCAGPYAHQLLNLDEQMSHRYCSLVKKGNNIYRPGWTRFSINYFTSAAEADYILEAVSLIAEQGWKMLPHYMASETAGNWQYGGHRMPLADLSWDYPENGVPADSTGFASALNRAQEILTEHETGACDHHRPFDNEARWFAVASDLNAQ